MKYFFYSKTDPTKESLGQVTAYSGFEEVLYYFAQLKQLEPGIFLTLFNIETKHENG